MRKLLVGASIFTILLLPKLTLAEEINAGFVQGLWYSADEMFVDEPVRIYVAIRNNTDSDLTGSVEFYVDSRLIERSQVSALSGRLIESWADWTPTYGEHKVEALLSKIKLHQVGGDSEAVEVTAGLAEDLIFVDYDTDGDGVGNETDEDDDGDGLDDEDEIENGTDPLEPDEPIEPEVEVEETEAEQDTSEETTKTKNTTKAKSSDTNSGLEQYLVDSPVENALSQVTTAINNTKANLDNYRNGRSNETSDTQATGNSGQDQTTEDIDQSLLESSSTNSSAFDESGFGEVTRSQDSTEKSGGLQKILRPVLGLVNKAYDLVLSVTSSYLGHPALVQVTLLLLILFIIFKLARRLAQRQNS